MIDHKQHELLMHSVTQKYLEMKWNLYGKYVAVANLLSYLVFLLSLTVYVTKYYGNNNLMVDEFDQV